MAVNPVNLCADLQAWRSAGLSFLYFSGLDAFELLKSAPRQAAARCLHSAADEALRLAGHNAPEAPGDAARAPARGAERQIASFPAGESKNTYESAGVSAAPDQPQKTAMTVADVSSVLPKDWEAVLTKVKPAPVVWTYRELGEDLMVKGDPERSRALRELIGGLGLKSGTSAFLPIVLPGRPDDGSEGWCFQSLLGRLGGRILVSFGSEALALGPYAMFGLEPFQEKIVQGRMLLCLPAFSEILANQARFEATRVFLRSAFGKINIL